MAAEDVSGEAEGVRSRVGRALGRGKALVHWRRKSGWVGMGGYRAEGCLAWLLESTWCEGADVFEVPCSMCRPGFVMKLYVDAHSVQAN